MVGTAAGTFARPGVVRQGWYLVARSSQVHRGHVKPVDVGSRRLIVHRDLDGHAHVTDDRCPHLGSDLALARVTPQGLLCQFHGWCWGADGSCVAAPGNPAPIRRRLRRYASEERWGFIWAWTGCEPAFPLPAVPAHLGRQVVLLPHRLHAHPDVIFSNGFDLAHFGPSHGIEASTASLDVGPWTIDHRIVGRLSKRKTLRVVGLAGTELDFSFVQYGGGIVHVHVRKPIEYLIFFTLRQDARFRARTRTMLFLRRRTDLPRALAVLWSTALDDLRMMERIRWTGAFAKADAALERYASFVEALPLACPAEAHGPASDGGSEG
jgi:phenylpropionate dioxygenase-like ring-hydroxylating dioxygenase large terminal subunit